MVINEWGAILKSYHTHARAGHLISKGPFIEVQTFPNDLLWSILNYLTTSKGPFFGSKHFLMSRNFLERPYMRAFETRHIGGCGYEGYNLLYEFVVAFEHLSINTKVNLSFIFFKCRDISYYLALV